MLLASWGEEEVQKDKNLKKIGSLFVLFILLQMQGADIFVI